MTSSLAQFSGEVLLVDESGTILHADKTSRERIGLYRVEGRQLLDLVTRESRARVAKGLRDSLKGESRIEEIEFFTGTVSLAKLVRMQLADGALATAIIVFASHTGDDGWAVDTGTCRDHALGQLGRGISVQINRLQQELKRTKAKYVEARNSAIIDTPTGLNNRAGLDYWLQKEVESGGAEGTRLFLVYLDLDDFKRFNDRHGHFVGDKVLRGIGRRLKASSKVVCAARVGGDEFAILARHEGRLSELQQGLQSVLERVLRPARINGLQLRFSASAGFSVFGDDAFDMLSLKEHADTALVEAKQAGKRRVRQFDSQLAERSRRRAALERDLPQALQSGAIRPVYQPIIPAVDGLGYGVEVLSRWDHYEFGAVPPGEFVSLASQTGVISDLDIHIARRSCAELAPLIENGSLEFVSLNISPLQLMGTDHIERLIAAVEASGIPPQKICIEVTESEFISDTDSASEAMARLRRAGISIALDDYGTGYSNLRALLDVPMDKLKIDRSLVHQLASDERTMRVVMSVIHLARIFDADLVAEGIETREQALVAKAMGCHYLQGFAFSRPLELNALKTWLTGHKSKHLFAESIAEPRLQAFG